MQIRAIDHFVLVVLSIEATVAFYTRVLGMTAEEMTPGRWALKFGEHKINLQQLHNSVDPNTRHPTRGAGDFCLLTDTPIEDVATHLKAQGVTIIEGPVRRTGATGPILSVYFYDPDENLVEISNLVGDSMVLSSDLRVFRPVSPCGPLPPPAYSPIASRPIAFTHFGLSACGGSDSPNLS